MKADITLTVGGRTVDLTEARGYEITSWLGTLDTKAKNGVIRRLVDRIEGVRDERQRA